MEPAKKTLIWAFLSTWPLLKSVSADESWVFRNGDDDYFQENVDIDTVNELEKIDVPNFKNGRTGRFIHDFNTNYTGILDVTGKEQGNHQLTTFWRGFTCE